MAVGICRPDAGAAPFVPASQCRPPRTTIRNLPGPVSRLRLFIHGVASSYVSMAAVIVTSLISVPLALHFLSKESFGLWALLTQIISYLMLIDFGMTPSVARLLIECKDSPQDGAYARLVHTGFLVTAVQGAVVLAIGFLLAPWLAA